MLKNEKYMEYLRERQASLSIGASTARGMGPAGTIRAAREFLKKINIERFQKQTEIKYLSELDAATEEFRKSLPSGARNWGSARKFLNIFLRGCSYNKYLSEYYKLNQIEKWFEIPLDSHVANGLIKIAGPGKLPRWGTVIRLTQQDSASYQSFASEVARLDSVNRVDVDIKLWRRDGQ